MFDLVLKNNWTYHLETTQPLTRQMMKNTKKKTKATGELKETARRTSNWCKYKLQNQPLEVFYKKTVHIKQVHIKKRP